MKQGVFERLPRPWFQSNGLRVVHSVFVHLNVVFSFLFLTLPVAFASLLDPSGDSCHNIARIWSRWILFCSGVKVSVTGSENLLPNRPQVLFCNHQSYFDVVCLMAHIPLQFRWLAKEELFRIPLFGWAMRKAGYLSVDRSNARKAIKSIKEAAHRIRQGTSILIFPEGTRSQDGRMQPLRAGGADLAIRAGVPAIPMFISGTHMILPKGSLLVAMAPVEIRIGRPIYTEGLHPRDKRTLTERLREQMLQLAAQAHKG